MTVATTEAPLCTELEEAMTNVVATLKRMPAHWEDRRAGMHRKLNDLLDQWQAARG